MRSLQQLDRDHAVREERPGNWYSFKTEDSGEKALAGARYGLALKSAQAPAVATANGAVESQTSTGIV